MLYYTVSMRSFCALRFVDGFTQRNNNWRDRRVLMLPLREQFAPFLRTFASFPAVLRRIWRSVCWCFCVVHHCICCWCFVPAPLHQFNAFCASAVHRRNDMLRHADVRVRSGRGRRRRWWSARDGRDRLLDSSETSSILDKK